MLKRAVLRLIHGGKATEEPVRSEASRSGSLPPQDRPKRYRDRCAGLADPTLTSLLDDYDMAIEGLRRWQASNHPHAARRVREYRTLIAEIEAEILAALDRETS